MNEIVPAFRLFNYLTAGEGWGRAAGAKARAKLAQHIAARQAAGTVRISLQSVRRLDLACAAEVLIGLIQDGQATHSYCLVDLGDSDVRENIAAAAERAKVPLTAWTGAAPTILGPEPSRGNRGALAFALERPEVRAAEFAAIAEISTANASMKFRQLWTEGFLLRSEDTAPSGGTEFIYRRIGG